jgi:hypothetical protein
VSDLTDKEWAMVTALKYIDKPYRVMFAYRRASKAEEAVREVFRYVHDNLNERVDINRATRTITWRGHTLMFRSFSDPSDRDKVKGYELSEAVIDEFPPIPEDCKAAILSRIRPTMQASSTEQ